MQKLIAALLAIITILLGVLIVQNTRAGSVPPFSTPYQAVVLTGGQVYYGKLENAGGLYPILRDVFYVSTQINPATKESATVIVRRGKELHGPEYMVLNRQSILFVEPIREDSQIARFIAEQNKGN
jgi:hypothetical protein